MTSGVITTGVSDVVEWEIPDFLSNTPYLTESSRFELVGCTFHMSMYSANVGKSMEIHLIQEDKIAPKTGSFSLGLKTNKGVLEEYIRFSNTFVEDNGLSSCWCRFSREYLRQRKSELLPSGALTATCRFAREIPTPDEVAANPGQVDSRRAMLVELEDLSSDLKDLLTNDRKSDFTINVQGKEFRTHRYLLSARSSVFRAMLEHDTAEARSGILTIPDCDPESFGEFLSFLYTGKTEEMTYRTAYHLYATGEKYDVQKLKSFCASYLKQNMTPENVCDVVVLADRYSDDKLLSSTQNFFNENYHRIFLTSEWKAMLKQNVRLVDKLLSEMSSAALETS